MTRFQSSQSCNVATCQRCRGRFTRTFVVAVGFFLLVAATASAQEPRFLAGRVVNKSGKGVAEARVWVVGGPSEATKTIADALTDRDGKFSFGPLPASSQPEKRAMVQVIQASGFDLVARSKDGRFAWIGRYQHPATGCQKPGTLTRRIRRRSRANRGPGWQADSGRPDRPRRLQRQVKPGMNTLWANLPAALSAELGARTAADGSFVIKGLPRDTQIHAKITTRDFGSAEHPVVSRRSNHHHPRWPIGANHGPLQAA